MHHILKRQCSTEQSCNHRGCFTDDLHIDAPPSVSKLWLFRAPHLLHSLSFLAAVLYNMPFFGRESSRPCPPFSYLVWQCSEQGSLPHVTLEGNRAAASWLTQDLRTALKLHVDTMLSGSLVLVCQLLPMPRSRSKSEDCERGTADVYALQCCTLQNPECSNSPHTHTYLHAFYTHTHAHARAHTRADWPPQASFPIQYLQQFSAFFSTQLCNTPVQVFALVHYKLFPLFPFPVAHSQLFSLP